MKKRTMWSRLVSMVLVLVIGFSIPMQAFTTEIVSGQVGVETTGGNYETVDVTVKIEETVNSDGSTNIQTSVEADNYQTESGMIVDYSESSNMRTDAEGVTTGEAQSSYSVSDSTGTYGAAGGSELTVTPQAPDVTVDVPLTDEDDPDTDEIENQNIVTSDSEAGDVVDVTGDLKESEDDGVYDYTITVVDKPGSATVTTTDITVTETVDGKDTELDPVTSETPPDETNDLIKENVSAAPEEYLPGSDTEDPQPPEEIVEGYEFQYVGTGNTSQLWPAVVFTEPLTAEQKIAQFGNHPENGAYIYKGYYTNDFVGWLNEEYRKTVARTEDGDYVTDEQGYILDIYGNRVLKEEQTMIGPDGETYYLHRFDALGSKLQVEGWYQDGEWEKELNGSNKYMIVYSTSQNYVLVDQETGEVVTTYCADVSTKTQNGYGYNIENLEDADYYTEEQAQQIRSIALNGYWGTVGYETDSDGNTVLDSGGNPVPKVGSMEALRTALLASGQFTEEELEELTDGVAMTATQMAIWSCSNNMQGIQFVNAHYIGSPGNTETDKYGANALTNVPAAKEAEAKLMFKLYEYLKSLEPTSYEGEETTANTIINADNFLSDVSLTVLDKADGHANNQDTDSTNDAYVTNLSFALVVTPSTENGDDLTVSVLDKNGNVVASGRIAGEAQEGENVLTPDDKGNYSFQGITLTEGTQNFNITLEGIQNLAEGVYLYSSEVRTNEYGDDVSSQTLVGIAEGQRGVNVSMNIAFELSVEDEIVVKERVWRKEWTKSGDGGGGGSGSEDPEDVEMAKPPKTGDGSLLYSILSALSGMSLAGLQLFKKRKKKVPEEVQQAAEAEIPDDPPAENIQEQDAVCADTEEPGEAAHQDSPAEAEAVQPSAEKKEAADSAEQCCRKEVYASSSAVSSSGKDRGYGGSQSGAGKQEVGKGRCSPTGVHAPGGGFRDLYRRLSAPDRERKREKTCLLCRKPPRPVLLQ